MPPMSLGVGVLGHATEGMGGLTLRPRPYPSNEECRMRVPLDIWRFNIRSWVLSYAPERSYITVPLT